MLDRVLTPEMFRRRYADVFAGDSSWQSLEAPTGGTYAWAEQSTYVRHPTFFAAGEAQGFCRRDRRAGRWRSSATR